MRLAGCPVPAWQIGEDHEVSAGTGSLISLDIVGLP